LTLTCGTNAGGGVAKNPWGGTEGPEKGKGGRGVNEKLLRLYGIQRAQNIKNAVEGSCGCDGRSTDVKK